jgi:hypothetical protein
VVAGAGYKFDLRTTTFRFLHIHADANWLGDQLTSKRFQLRNTSAAVTESSSGGCGPMPLNGAECGNEIQSVQCITA